MTKITYLLGAGASANCIPVVKNLTIGIEDFHNYFWGKLSSYFQNSDQNILSESEKQAALDELDNFLKIVKKNPTVDTYAKKLFISEGINSKKLMNFKILLVTYFLYQQWATPPDERYDKFFASIIDKNEQNKIILPPNIKILTWNYDIQPEICFADYINSGSTQYHIEKFQDDLNCIPGCGNNKYVSDKFQIVKLNGTAGLYLDFTNGFKIYFNTNDINYERKRGIRAISGLTREFDIVNDNSIYGLIRFYIDNIIQTNNKKFVWNSFTYSWETLSIINEALSTAKSIAEETEVLIVIGYSFPFVNRKIDSPIFEKMKNLKRLYIQDINYDADMVSLLKQRFPILQKEDLIFQGSRKVDEFYLPPEL